MKLHIVKRFYIGIKRKPIHFLISVFFVYGIFWATIEPLLVIVKSSEKYLTGIYIYLVIVFISIIVGFFRSVPHTKIKLTDNIQIIFGDLFTFEGYKAIPVSQFFYETEVIESSLQNIVIKKFINSDEGVKGLNKYLYQLDTKLAKKPAKLVYRTETNTEEKYYPLGTAINIEFKNEEYILFAITKTEHRGNIPNDNCDVNIMWDVLDKFWKYARENSRGQAINIPLIGSGVTGINLPELNILEINLIALKNSMRERGKITTNEVRIILHPMYYQKIDLDYIKHLWGR
jgi:hypothetical protein